MAAYRQAKRMQRGALTAQGWFNSESPELLNVPCTIQSVFVAKNVSKFQNIFSSGINDNILPNITTNLDYVRGVFANTAYRISNPFDRILNVVFVVKTDLIEMYVGGDKVAEGSAAIDSLTWYYLGNYKTNTSFNFQGDYLLHRHFNYAMSADEVKALDNNNDPMGYIVPSNYKILGDTYISDFSEGADGWYVTPLTDYVTITVSDGAVVVSKDSANQNMIIGRLHSPYNVQISNYSVQLKFSEPLPSQVISVDVRPFNSISGVTLNISPDRLTASDIFINSTSKPNGGSLIIFRATGPVSISISSISFTPSICLAEYLPQNLMYSKDDKTIATSWLDSAKQMPLSDEYMEPLFQSIGGYDMAANGAPEILYNE